MLKIDQKVLREAQLIMLDMLVEFDKVCKKHNLQYWLDSETLLGAIRHKGFIPWDDDIDLSMPVEDYSRFVEIAQEELPDFIFFQTTKTDNKFPFDYIKLRSQKVKIVEFHEKDRDVDYHQGVFLNIFPMLTILSDDYHKKFYDNIFSLIRSASAVSLHTPNGIDRPEIRAKLEETLESIHQGWDNRNNKVIYGGEMPDVSAWFDLKKVFPLKKMEFEGMEFYVPNDPKHYLGAIYSFNFMELPPMDKRTTHAHKMILL